jgi:hypothetical protein
LEGIRELDFSGEGRVLVEEEKVRKEFARELERLLLCEEVSWRQKPRALWLREGDKNTFFFIGWLTQIEEIILSILVNVSLSLDSTEIREHVVQLYMQLYSEQYS